MGTSTLSPSAADASWLLAIADGLDPTRDPRRIPVDRARVAATLDVLQRAGKYMGLTAADLETRAP